MGVFFSGNVASVLMEYAAGGSLAGAIKAAAQQRAPLVSARVRRWTRQLALGLHYVHEQKVIHRDVTPSNILLGDEDVIKITDFGWSKSVLNMQMVTTFAGTPCAPRTRAEYLDSPLPFTPLSTHTHTSRTLPATFPISSPPSLHPRNPTPSTLPLPHPPCGTHALTLPHPLLDLRAFAPCITLTERVLHAEQTTWRQRSSTVSLTPTWWTRGRLV